MVDQSEKDTDRVKAAYERKLNDAQRKGRKENGNAPAPKPSRAINPLDAARDAKPEK
jgi:hypothetical protein